MTFKFTAPSKTLASSLAIAVALSASAFAQGGNDPISGIDIIIKRDPGSQPIKPGEYGQEEIGLTYNAGMEKLQDPCGEFDRPNDEN